MFTRGEVGGVCAVGLAVAWLLATPGAADASQRNDEKRQDLKLSRDEQAQVQAAYQLVDGVMHGEPAPEAQAFTITWRHHFLKAEQGRIYVPYTLAIDQAALTTPDVTFYVRVVAREAEEAADAPKEAKDAPAVYAYEGVWFPTLKAPASGRPYEISRAFAVPTGEYDVYVAIREKTKDRRTAAKASVLKQPLSVPDFWNGEFNTSTVILADSVAPLAAALSPEEQLERPYTIGRMQIVPAADATFTKSEELAVIFLVYNPGLKENKPDVLVEYRFHHKTAEGEKYFNRTEPNVLNAEGLPPEFDLTAGYELVAGQSVSLEPFPPGDYRLEIEVQDKLSQKTLTRDVFFTVEGS